MKNTIRKLVCGVMTIATGSAFGCLGNAGDEGRAGDVAPGGDERTGDTAAAVEAAPPDTTGFCRHVELQVSGALPRGPNGILCQCLDGDGNVTGGVGCVHYDCTQNVNATQAFCEQFCERCIGIPTVLQAVCNPAPTVFCPQTP